MEVMSSMIVIVIDFDNLKLLQENNYDCRTNCDCANNNHTNNNDDNTDQNCLNNDDCDHVNKYKVNANSIQASIVTIDRVRMNYITFVLSREKKFILCLLILKKTGSFHNRKKSVHPMLQRKLICPTYT